MRTSTSSTTASELSGPLCSHSRIGLGIFTGRGGPDGAGACLKLDELREWLGVCAKTAGDRHAGRTVHLFAKQIKRFQESPDRAKLPVAGGEWK